jgi:hypothetical protein
MTITLTVTLSPIGACVGGLCGLHPGSLHLQPTHQVHHVRMWLPVAEDGSGRAPPPWLDTADMEQYLQARCRLR